MFSAAGDSTKFSPIQSLSSPVDLAQELLELQTRGASDADLLQLEHRIADALKQPVFEIKKLLPSFLQIVKNLDASGAFGTIRLPGRDILVADRRESPKGTPSEPAKAAVGKLAGEMAKSEIEKKSETKTAKEKSGEMRVKDGKLVKSKEKISEGAAGVRSMDQQVATDRLQKMLSAFERMVIERFENGREIEQRSADGRPKFLQKTDAQWKEFFQSFLNRTVSKKVLISDIREFLLRGLIPKGEKGIFIGDMKLTSGRVEKFVRFLLMSDAAAKLKNLMPGDAFGTGALGDLNSEELLFLALAASRGREAASSMLPTQGKFIGGRAEAEAAQALGLPLTAQLRQKTKMLKKGGGLFGGDLLGDGRTEDLPYQFIPWWRWGNLKTPSRFKWVTVAFYGTMLALALMGIALLSYRLLLQ